jgi:hypothetical protein
MAQSKGVTVLRTFFIVLVLAVLFSSPIIPHKTLVTVAAPGNTDNAVIITQNTLEKTEFNSITSSIILGFEKQDIDLLISTTIYSALIIVITLFIARGIIRERKEKNSDDLL